jgi:hypothetical protein
MTPKKIYISEHGVRELNKGYYATAFPDEDKVSIYGYHSDEAIKAWIEDNMDVMSNEVDAIELKKFLQSKKQHP